MSTGDEIFAELIQDSTAESQNLIKLYQPYQVKIVNVGDRATLVLSPWQLFSDDMTYFVQADNVVCINTLDDQHRMLYGAMVSNTELKQIQNELAAEVQNGTITRHFIEEALKATFMVIMKSGIKYNTPMPEKERVKTDFYSFLMNQYPNSFEVKH